MATTTKEKWDTEKAAHEKVSILEWFIHTAEAAIFPGQNSDTVYEYEGLNVRTDQEQIFLHPGGYIGNLGMRFPNITIPKNSTVNSSKITVTATRTRSESVSATIYGQAADNPATFALTLADFDNRTRTSGVTSNPESWTSGSTYDTASLVSITQTLVNRSGWASGNAQVYFWEDAGSANGNYRTILGYLHGSGYPYLTITYTEPSGPAASTDLLVNGLTNPSNVSTTSPYFSGVHVNASSTAQAAYYQIQIATSSSYWGAPTWDSGKKTLSPQTPAGSRTADLYSTTTLAFNGSTYYWRVVLHCS